MSPWCHAVLHIYFVAVCCCLKWWLLLCPWICQDGGFLVPNFVPLDKSILTEGTIFLQSEILGEIVPLIPLHIAAVYTYDSCHDTGGLAKQFYGSRCSGSLAMELKKLTAQAVYSKQAPMIRTTESDPTKHTSNDVGLFYTLPRDDVERWVSCGLSKRAYRSHRAFNETCLMVVVLAAVVVVVS